MRVGVMRPLRYRGECMEALAHIGADVSFVPFIEVQPLEGQCVHEAVARLKAGISSTAVFTSANGVDIAFERAGEELQHVLTEVDVVAIGPRTKKALAERGIPSTSPAMYSSEGLADLLADVRGGIEVLRSAHGDATLMQKLRGRAHECILYEIVKLCTEHQRGLLQAVVDGEVDALLFTSRMMVESFFECARGAGVLDRVVHALSRMDVIAIGPPTKRALGQVGVGAKMPTKYTFSAMVGLLEGWTSG
ncbi:MAG: uroporphyrinogen-III synthase [Methermicoccaceae archaeon]